MVNVLNAWKLTRAANREYSILAHSAKQTKTDCIPTPKQINKGLTKKRTWDWDWDVGDLFNEWEHLHALWESSRAALYMQKSIMESPD